MRPNSLFLLLRRRPSASPCSPTTTYDIDPAALERRYKLLQWQLHPDKTVQRTEEEKEFSAAQASLINQAYSVLRSPLARANYLVGVAFVVAHTPGGGMHLRP